MIRRRRSMLLEHQAMRAASSPAARPAEGVVPVVHVNPYAQGIYWDGIQHGGPPWRGVCIAGLHIGTHYFPRRGKVIAISGVFGNVGNRPGLRRQPCPKPVRFRCRMIHNGKVLPFWWLSCGEPSHMNGAGVIETLDAQGFVTEMEHVGFIEELENPLAPPELPPPPSPTMAPRAALPPKGGSRRGWGKSQ